MNQTEGEVHGSTTSTRTDADEGRLSTGTYTKSTQKSTFANTRSTSTSNKKTMSSRIPNAISKVGNIRGPWIPAPAKSTNASNGDLLQHHQYQLSSHPIQSTVVNSSSSSYGSLITTPRPKSYVASVERGNSNITNSRNKMKRFSQHTSVGTVSTATQKHHLKEFRHSKKSTSKVKLATKHGSRHFVAGGYKLQAKDSLVDVTTCLQAKRAEVMNLREKLLLRDDPQLLSQIEITNRLALEATEEVEILRETIQAFQQKDDGLSEADLLKLEKMRTKVLGKVREFEEADNTLQNNIIERKSPLKTPLKSTFSKKSQTDITNNEKTPGSGTIQQANVHLTQASGSQFIPRKSRSSPNVKELIVLKEKSHNFAADSQSEEEECIDYTMKQQQLLNPQKSVEAIASAVPSMDDLTRLKLLYDEALNFPPINNVLLTESRSNLGLHTIESLEKQNRFQNQVRFTGGQQELLEGVPESGSTTYDGLYRQKISTLQRKLMDTEQEMEELRSEIERIESDANFRVRMLHNTLKDKFDNLEVIPEYLHIVEQKLHETGEVKVQLQNQLHCNQKCLQDEKELNKVMKKEADGLKERLRTIENSRDFLKLENSELETSNVELRKELESITRQMASELRVTKEKEANVTLMNTSPKLAWENEKLKIQCSELTDQLGQSQRMIESLKKSKTKQSLRLNERIEELIEALNEVHDHKRQLCDTIRNLRKSYYRLFPDDVSMMCKRSSHSRKSKLKKKRPVVESNIAQTAWMTGAPAQANLNISEKQNMTPLTVYQTSIIDPLNLQQTNIDLGDDNEN